ncbi:hypothetical protein BofuT4_P034420.1 [Botrytis cinerea T4]|uniref:Uncharacterized protein n=1 Tax=Botryotinia fuckeliana (strain T4) TaxID=999810 RepID=G2Y872_BOTF4|nr:hypothetical protein BofuT4_P034420.1 [Botrytis cinerea T4]
MNLEARLKSMSLAENYAKIPLRTKRKAVLVALTLRMPNFLRLRATKNTK